MLTLGEDAANPTRDGYYFTAEGPDQKPVGAFSMTRECTRPERVPSTVDHQLLLS